MDTMAVSPIRRTTFDSLSAAVTHGDGPRQSGASDASRPSGISRCGNWNGRRRHQRGEARARRRGAPRRPHVAELRGARAPRPGGPHDRPRADDGRAPRRPPEPDPPRPRRMRHGRREPLRQPRRSSPPARTLRSYPRDEARDAALAARGGRRRAVRAARGGGLPRRAGHDGRGARGRERALRRARARGPGTSGASRPSSPSSSTCRSPTSPTSARRTSSRRS